MKETSCRLLVLLALCLISLTIGAQRFRHHEFSSSLGFGANIGDKEVNDMLDRYDRRYHLNVGDDYEDLVGKSFVTFNLEYHYRLDKQWAVGAIMGWGHSGDTYSCYDNVLKPAEGMENSFTTIRKHGDEKSNTFYLAPSLRYAWFVKGKFRLYSRVALGAMRQHTTFKYRESTHLEMLCDLGHYHEVEAPDLLNQKENESSDETKWKLAYQLTTVGFDFGIEPIRVFSELGYGCQGVFTLGVRLAL